MCRALLVSSLATALGGCGARDLLPDSSPVRSDGAGETPTGSSQAGGAPAGSLTTVYVAGQPAGAGGASETTWSDPVDSEGRVQTEGELRIPVNPYPRLEDDNLLVVAQIKTFLDHHPEVTTLRIEGHTDNRDTHAHNLQIAGLWALAAKNWLIDHGVRPERLLAVSFGETYPVADNATEEGRAQNRRVEFYVASINGITFLGRPLEGPPGGYVF